MMRAISSADLVSSPSDACLLYTSLIDCVGALEALYGRILIPPSVHDELLDLSAPAKVRAWAKDPPHWVEILSPSITLKQWPANLDLGETEAITLAEELHSDWLLIDEAAGRSEAQRRGLQTIGTLGILRNAHALKDVYKRQVLHRSNLRALTQRLT